MEIFEFIHLIEISRLVEISDAQKFSGLWKPMYEAFTFHLSFDCNMHRKKKPQLLLRSMENVCLIRNLTCASLYSPFSNKGPNVDTFFKKRRNACLFKKLARSAALFWKSPRYGLFLKRQFLSKTSHCTRLFKKPHLLLLIDTFF